MMYEKTAQAKRIEASTQSKQAWKTSRKDFIKMLTDWLGGKPTNIETVIASKAFTFGYMKAADNSQDCEAS